MSLENELQERDEEAELLAQLEAEDLAEKKRKEEEAMAAQAQSNRTSATLDSLQTSDSDSEDDQEEVEETIPESQTPSQGVNMRPDLTQEKLEADTGKLITKYFGSWTNESNLDLDDHLVITVTHKSNHANSSMSKMFSLKEKIIELLNGKFGGMRFKNDERAKSVIVLIRDLESIGNFTSVSNYKKYKAIEVILSQHKAIDPRG